MMRDRHRRATFNCWTPALTRLVPVAPVAGKRVAPVWLEALPAALRDTVKENEPLAKYTAARLGGPADYFAFADTPAELVALAQAAWQHQVPLVILGGGSNVLVSDAGVRGLVVLNRAKQVTFAETPAGLRVTAESGANFGLLARQCVAQGWAGLEWAATVPGSVGGAVYGNAGAHGGAVADNLVWAEVVTTDAAEPQRWPCAALNYSYRTSALKQAKARGQAQLVLVAQFAMTPAPVAELQARVEAFVAHRKRTQPPGASLGSMFKNPPGDYAGRLIEAAGLKGTRVGAVEISTVHANFFINQGAGRAQDILALLHLAHDTVKRQFGVELELEVELVGEWNGKC